MKNLYSVLVCIIIITSNPFVAYSQIADFDGNTYRTVQIGTQFWMAENLKTTKYINGDPILLVNDSLQWVNLNDGAYFNIDNDPTNAAKYGCLYNLYAVTDPRKICPKGWHVPDYEELNTLIKFLGGGNAAGPKLKSTSGWAEANGTNSSGFTALPPGCGTPSLNTWGTGIVFQCWSFDSYFLQLNFKKEYGAILLRKKIKDTAGNSVRCIKD